MCAVRVKHHEFTKRGRGNSKYPWDQWSDGAIWLAQQEKDFSVSPKSFEARLRAKATSIDMNVRVNKRGVAVFFQFYKERCDG